MNKPAKVIFLSYAHADLEAVTRIYEHLVAAGLNPWMDKFNLLPGQVWRDEIERAIRHSGAFLSIISPSSVDRGGILRGEMKLALDLRAERLDDRGILIPVRLERCEMPKDLHDIQTLDWFLPDGPARLTKALASLVNTPPARKWPWVLALALAVCVGAGAILYRLKTPAAPPRIDLTVWRVSEDAAGGSGPCAGFRFTRQPLDQPVRTNDRLRLDVRTSRPGYVYIIDKGALGVPKLLFPVKMVNEGDNRVTAGRPLLIPPTSDVCNTLQLTHADTAEEITVVFSEKKLDTFPLHDEPWQISREVYQKLQESVNASPTFNGPASNASDDVPRELGYTSSSGADAGFRFSDKAQRPLVARFTLKTQK